LYAEHDLAAHRDHERRYSVLECIGTGHRVVLVSLIVTIISGVLLFASDADAFLHSRFFWTKMALVGLLIVNGAFLRYADKRAIHNPDDQGGGRREFVARLISTAALALAGAGASPAELLGASVAAVDSDTRTQR